LCDVGRYIEKVVVKMEVESCELLWWENLEVLPKLNGWVCG
jgi:hypothetical protein